ncbi:MAG: polysaccharide biosynthesis protein [Syntrophomonadaceae bacterium]|jgi:FlaA1/EpsC-like NDP-sugar epimerase|nr:polysaccharide biosynthesis protein [Syntrophomonadaceae bacterium]
MRSFNKYLLIMITTDIILINAALYLAMLIRFDSRLLPQYGPLLMRFIPAVTITYISFFLLHKLYERVWKYTGLNDLLSIVKATSISMIVSYMIGLLYVPALPFTLYILHWIFTNMLTGAFRLALRLYPQFLPGSKERTNIMIVGAGNAGARLMREIQANPGLGYNAAAFIDDDPKKAGKMLLGVPVKGNRNDIPRLARDLQIQEIIIAMPSVQGQAIRDIFNICKLTSKQIKILPSLLREDITPVTSNIRKVEIEDLLGRCPVELDLKRICIYLQDKTILVTGGGGSIGSELCRQIMRFQPRQLIILDNSENNLFDIEAELWDSGWASRINVQLMDVKERSQLDTVFRRYRPEVVFHAAAYKHVPMMERHPDEALHNNVLGTLNIAELADIYGSETFILISTDKAVNPTSVMGACKRLAEIFIEDLDRYSDTNYAAVRFGNVLGSRGSVIKTFEKQIKKGGPVTITHPDMTRYFMTIPEAVELVLQAGSIAGGGEIFVLDMGEPVKITDLARGLIELYGLKPEEDIAFSYTGIRPGEKLFEELFFSWEELSATRRERIMVSQRELDVKYFGISKQLVQLIKDAGNNRDAILDLISYMVPEYHRPDPSLETAMTVADTVQELH